MSHMKLNQNHVEVLRLIGPLIALTNSPETESNAVRSEYRNQIAQTLVLCFRQTKLREQAMADTSLSDLEGSHLKLPSFKGPFSFMTFMGLKPFDLLYNI